MKKRNSLSYYKMNKVKDNLDHWYNLATIEEIRKGNNWYFNAFVEAEFMAMLFGIPIEKVVGVIAALSPNNKWERNLQDAHKMCMHYNSGSDNFDKIKVCTYDSNKNKAIEILNISDNGDENDHFMPEIKKILNGRKTISFFDNIVNHEFGRKCSKRVTIDRWHLRICFDQMREVNLTDKVYDELEKITLKKAEEKGLKGFQFQAIIWEVIRNQQL